MLEPFVLTGDHFFHGPSFIKLFLCLQKVSSIGPEESLLLWDNSNCIGSCKTWEESNSLVAFGKVLALMLVGPRKDIPSELIKNHKFPELGKDFGCHLLFNNFLNLCQKYYVWWVKWTKIVIRLIRFRFLEMHYRKD